MIFSKNEILRVTSTLREGDGVDRPARGEALRLRVRYVSIFVRARAETQESVITAFGAKLAFHIFTDSDIKKLKKLKKTFRE